MIIGEFQQKVGAKKRIAIPSVFRKELKGKLYITRGYEQSLVIVDEQRWEKIISPLVQGPMINNSIRQTSRILIGGAREITTDPQGRFVLPDNLFVYAGIMSDIVWVGLINWIEIWNVNAWSNQLKYLKTHGGEIAEHLTSTY
ncbi:MAG TPA: hypothetical protein PK957_04870 [Candidatus Dojkabacteria bacterium]|nr:hypothetical protein [Candidatus Dojkabacteria bacterium]HQF36564.1 hypothetical protein [Candidatus Dojkabacteria bacterium]